MTYKLTHLDELESESIYVLREVAAQFENPVILFSGGKDSIVVTHLAHKAFFPAKIPFPLLHIDTGDNFKETIEFRDQLVKELSVNLIVGYVQDSINKGLVEEEKGYEASRNALQSVTLLDTISTKKIDCAIGGARRDEEKARAKERFFSHRDIEGHWDPKNQRPELWNIFNGKKHYKEHFRAFPISNWTEMDVWQYIYKEKIRLPSIYFAHDRDVFYREGQLLAAVPQIKIRPTEKVITRHVRCRTVGDVTCTGMILSNASSLEDIINEVAATRITERGGRMDDKRSDCAMEERKKVGYF